MHEIGFKDENDLQRFAANCKSIKNPKLLVQLTLMRAASWKAYKKAQELRNQKLQIT